MDAAHRSEVPVLAAETRTARAAASARPTPRGSTRSTSRTDRLPACARPRDRSRRRLAARSIGSTPHTRSVRTITAMMPGCALLALLVPSRCHVGCATTSYKIPATELQRLAQVPPEQRGQHVRVIQQLGDDRRRAGVARRRQTQIVIFPQINVYGPYERRRYYNYGGGGGGGGNWAAAVGRAPRYGGGGGHRAAAAAAAATARPRRSRCSSSRRPRSSRSRRSRARGSTATRSCTRCTRSTCSARTAATPCCRSRGSIRRPRTWARPRDRARERRTVAAARARAARSRRLDLRDVRRHRHAPIRRRQRRQRHRDDDPARLFPEQRRRHRRLDLLRLARQRRPTRRCSSRATRSSSRAIRSTPARCTLGLYGGGGAAYRCEDGIPGGNSGSLALIGGGDVPARLQHAARADGAARPDARARRADDRR